MIRVRAVRPLRPDQPHHGIQFWRPAPAPTSPRPRSDPPADYGTERKLIVNEALAYVNGAAEHEIPDAYILDATSTPNGGGAPGRPDLLTNRNLSISSTTERPKKSSSPPIRSRTTRTRSKGRLGPVLPPWDADPRARLLESMQKGDRRRHRPVHRLDLGALSHRGDAARGASRRERSPGP